MISLRISFHLIVRRTYIFEVIMQDRELALRLEFIFLYRLAINFYAVRTACVFDNDDTVANNHHCVSPADIAGWQDDIAFWRPPDNQGFRAERKLVY